MTVQYSVGKTNCLTEVPNNVNLELDPLNVTVVGSPTINNGVVSGFSSTNYLLLPNTFNPASSVWKKYFKIKTPSDISKNIAIVGSKDSQDFQHSAAGVSNNAHWTCWLSSNGTSWDIAKGTEGTYVVQPDTVYWVTLEFTGSAYILKYSLNGIDYIQDVIINTETTIYNGQNTPDMLGNGGTVLTNSTWQPVNTIYLTECYYTINGKEIWRGGNGNLTLKKGSKVYVPNGFEEDGITKKFDEIVIENDVIATNYTGYTFTAFACYVPELNRVLFDTEYAGSGNGFEYNTEENYLRLTGSYTDATWTGKLTTLPLGLIEMSSSIGVTSIKQVFNGFGYIGSTIFVLPGVKSLVSDGWNENGTYKNLNGITNNVIMRSNPNVGAKNICLYYDENGNASSIGFGIYDDTISTLSERESSWTSGHYVYVKDENKRYVNLNTTPSYLIVVTNMVVDSSTSKITSITPYETKTTNDLKNMQIKYGVGKTNCLTEIPQDINLELDSINVTVVGSPTFNNGVVSGFSTSNYLKIDKAFSGSQKWEVLLKFNTSGTYNGNKVLFDVSNNSSIRAITMYITSAMKMKIGLSNSASSNNIRSETETNYTFVANKDYQYKLSFDGSVYKGEVYDYDTESWIEDLLLENSTPVYTSNLIMIGCWQGLSSGTEYAGSIDIANSYIKVNDEIWWKGGTGSLTLKAGSKVCVPNGKNDDDSNKFDIKVVENDVKLSTYSMTSSTKLFVYTNTRGTSFGWRPIANAYSGTSDTGGLGTNFYDITNNIITAHNNAGDAQVSFPLAIITTNSSGIITSIYQIFNGFGYIGNTVFTLPGVKGLIPNGWNEDGTLNNIEKTLDEVCVVTNTVTIENGVIALTPGSINNRTGYLVDYNTYTFSEAEPTTVRWYRPSTNQFYIKRDGVWGVDPQIHIGMFSKTTTQITSFTPYEVKTINDTIDIKEVHQCVGKTNCLTELPNDINLELDPLNVTVVGTPTNSNGVVSGFSTSNYLLTPNSVDLNTVDNFEIVVRAKHGTGSLLQQHSNTPYTIALHCGLMLVRLNGGSSWTTIYENNTGLVEGNWYTIRASFDGLVYKFERAEDNGEFITLATLENSTKIISNNQSFILGINDVHSDPYLGSIDIPNCYIKINDQMWWKGGTGNLTLKAGSKVYIPNGFEEDGVTKKFDEVIVPEDMQAVIPDMIRTGAFLTYNINGRGQHLRHWSQWQPADVYSGSVEPTASGNKVWYDTTNNVIKEMNDGINWTVLQTSLPFCTFSSNPTVVTSIDQIFNGIGYIGSRYFMTNGVKCLEPDGWNEDGTYKVNERQSSNVYVSSEQTGDVTNRAICLTYNSNNELISDYMTNYYETQSRSDVSTGGWYFIKDENQIENFNGTTWQGKVYRTKVGSYQVTSGKITNFKVDNIKTTNDTKILY